MVIGGGVTATPRERKGVVALSGRRARKSEIGTEGKRHRREFNRKWEGVLAPSSIRSIHSNYFSEKCGFKPRTERSDSMTWARMGDDAADGGEVAASGRSGAPGGRAPIGRENDRAKDGN